MVWDPGAVLNIASGLLMGGLGTALLLANVRRDANRLFGLLAVFWGIQILAANTVRLTTDPDVAGFAGQLSLAFLIPLYFFITAFADLFPRPRAPFGTSPLAVAVLALPAGAALAALFLEPSSLIAGVETAQDGSLTLAWGPLLPYLVTAPFFGAVSYALYVMLDRLEEARGPVERKQVTAVLAAFGLFAGYYAPSQFAKFAGDALGVGDAPEALGAEAITIAVIMLVTLVILLVILAALVGRVRRRQGGPLAQEAGWALVALAGAMGTSLVVLGVQALGGPRLELLGLFRGGSVLLIVYAIARYQLFDLDLRAKRLSAVAGAVLAVAGVGAATLLALRELGSSATVQAAGTLLVALVAFLPALHASYRLADRVAPEITGTGDHLYLRKLEVYRSAVEAQLADGGTPDPANPDLVALRERLDLDERDHGVVVTLATAGAEPRRASPELTPGQRAFGKYELEAVLAEGGFGRVLLAHDTALARPVVIKELQAKWREDDTVSQRFLREARVAGGLQHPNIVTVHGLEQHGGDHYLILEHVAGGNLADRLEHGPLPVHEAVAVADQVLAALEAAHAKGVVHRDVKPANVLFDAEGRAKLTDFGIAHLTGQPAQATLSGLTTGGTQPGTLAYMSPEQAAGRPVDQASDLYAVGALLYRMLTGRAHVDLEGLGELEARTRIAETPPPEDVGDLPGELGPLVAKALANDPEDRFEDAVAFRQALADHAP